MSASVSACSCKASYSLLEKRSQFHSPIWPEVNQTVAQLGSGCMEKRTTCICIFFQPPALSEAIAFWAPLSYGTTSAWMPTLARPAAITWAALRNSAELRTPISVLKPRGWPASARSFLACSRFGPAIRFFSRWPIRPGAMIPVDAAGTPKNAPSRIDLTSTASWTALRTRASAKTPLSICMPSHQ